MAKIKTGKGCESVKAMKARAKTRIVHRIKLVYLDEVEWVITKEPAKDVPGWVHVQARTKDQLSSFACLFPESTQLLRTKTADGKLDVFSGATSDTSAVLHHATMNIVGKIEYRGF